MITWGELGHFQLVVAQSEMLLYVKFQCGLEVSWLGINPAGAKFLEIVEVYVNTTNMDTSSDEVMWMRKWAIHEFGCRNIFGTHKGGRDCWVRV